MKLQKLYCILLFILIVTICTNTYSKPLIINLGHRAGGGEESPYPEYPENSLISARLSLLGINEKAPLQIEKKFRYLEFDIQETYDGELVVFHDLTEGIQRMIPFIQNSEAYIQLISSVQFKKRFPYVNQYNLQIKHLTLEEIKTFRLKGDFDQQVPTFEEFLNTILEYGLQKPVAVELKDIRTDKAKRKMIRLVSYFREELIQRYNIKKFWTLPQVVNLIALKKNFNNLFSDKQEKKKWCKFFKENNFKGVFRCGMHFKNLCK